MKRLTKRIHFDRKLLVRRLVLMLGDVVLLAIGTLLSLCLRFEFDFSAEQGGLYLRHAVSLFPLAALVMLFVFELLGLYRSLWEYAGEKEFITVGLGSFLVASLQTLLHYVFHLTAPRSFLVLQFLLFSFLAAGFRLSYRFLRRLRSRYFGKGRVRVSHDKKMRTMLIGAGSAGAMTLKELQNSRHSKNNVVCILDDDSNKIGTYLRGVPIVGATDEILQAVKEYRVDEILLAIPSASSQKRSEILNICNSTGCRLRTLPGIYQLASGEVDIKMIRDVEIEELLFRDALALDDVGVKEYYEGKCVLVTGGGGSIGSELCRQIAACRPAKLVIFDIYENNAYEIQQELKRAYGDELSLCVEIGSVRDEERLEMLFSCHKPQVVFHAAAHKHVPLMETSPCEAIKNNVFGTYNTAEAAERHGVEKFILISTDKAVNPTNIMGASKRLCEMIVQSRTDSKTQFAAVRFGNVLGSNGSVIPLFRKQIAEGGPVTITDKRIIRYFMTIPEASQLVMEAGAMAKKGELFVLDMGKPVRIYDLAVNMIKLSGLEPEVDIPIVEIGLRPGEKLYEELLIKTETMTKTDNEMIFIETDKPHARETIVDLLASLSFAIAQDQKERGKDAVRRAMRMAVPTYCDPEVLNRTAESSEEMRCC